MSEYAVIGYFAAVHSDPVAELNEGTEACAPESISMFNDRGIVNQRSETLAPVALFAYRRPEHLRRTLDALRANREASQTELFIFCDGPKDASAVDDVDAVRDVAHKCHGFGAIQIVCRGSNLGLARNITEGVSEILDGRETVVVVEDDIVVSPFFLRFMNDALNLYRDAPRVGSISGYCYPVSMPVPETYFILGADCWGWATWRDRWREYNPDGRALLKELNDRNLDYAFDFDGTAGFVQMLKDQIAGKNDSWAVRWHASCYLGDRLMLYPGRSLAKNIGHDGSGTHSAVADDTLNVGLSHTPIPVGNIAIEESPQGREAICMFFGDLKKRTAANSSPPQQHPVECAPDPKPLMWRRLARKVLPENVIHMLRHARDRLAARSRSSGPGGQGVSKLNGRDCLKPLYWGLCELDRQIESYLDFDGGYFVELGANDGCFQSNTLYYERERGWRGVLVEPAQHLCRRCKESRSARNHVANAACVSFSYARHDVELIYSNAMSVSLNVESDIGDPLDHAELGRQFLKPGETVFNFGAIARTLNSILIEAGAPKRIDFLSLDVEGSEIEVLKGVDHDAFRFRYMLVECRDIDRLSDYLTKAGYQLVERFNEHDYLFADQGVRA